MGNLMQTTTVCLLALALLVSADGAAAKPTEAQLDAIKSNCRSDFMSNCWGVKRGGAEAFQCLKEHMASLSSGCQKAIKAATPAPAPAKTPQPAAPKPASAPAPEPAAPAAPAPQQEVAPKQEAPPAKQPETKSASPAPQESAPPPAPKAAAAPPPQQPVPEAVPPAEATTPEVPAPAASEAAPAIIGFIPPRKKLMVQRHCRQELETYCADVDVGQGRVLRCLFGHKSALTPGCQGALAKLSN